MIGIIGLHSKIGYPLVISGCFPFLESSSTLYINRSVIGSSVHMYVWICFPMAREMKYCTPHSISGRSAITTTVICLVLFMLHM